MTKRKYERMRVIIRELTRLSRNGWRDARPSDYLPLEREIKALITERRKETR